MEATRCRDGSFATTSALWLALDSGLALGTTLLPRSVPNVQI